jgi:hypothetical protein
LQDRERLARPVRFRTDNREGLVKDIGERLGAQAFRHACRPPSLVACEGAITGADG